MIEVEKKLRLNAAERAKLLSGAQLQDSHVIVDAYFDTDDFELTTNDQWLRLRNGKFELKSPPLSGSGSSGGANHYEEITGNLEIANKLELPPSLDLDAALALAGIRRFVRCETERTSYSKQDFRIDVDSVTYQGSDFTYALAEIELIVESEADIDAADQKILAFINELGLATDTVVVGKIVAYLQAEKPAHYSALVAAGVI